MLDHARIVITSGDGARPCEPVQLPCLPPSAAAARSLPRVPHPPNVGGRRSQRTSLPACTCWNECTVRVAGRDIKPRTQLHEGDAAALVRPQLRRYHAQNPQVGNILQLYS